MKVEIKKNMTTAAVISLLEDLVGSLKTGKVCVQSGQNFVTLRPGDDMELEFEASEKKNKQQLSLELNWRRVEPVVETPAAADFRISSEEPEIEVPEAEAALPENCSAEIKIMAS